MNHLSPIVATVVDEPPGDSLGRKESKRPFRLTVRGPRSSLCVACVVLGFVVSLAAILCWAYDQWRVGAQFDQRTFAGPQFALRITAFRQRDALMAGPGGFYQYEVKTASNSRWRKIAMFHFGRPAPIPSDQFRRLTDSCAYFFHRHIFGVTTDGGKTWSIQGELGHPLVFGGRPHYYRNIEAVAIDRDGAGTMRLSNIDYSYHAHWKRMPSYNLVTSDFGKTWTVR